MRSRSGPVRRVGSRSAHQHHVFAADLHVHSSASDGTHPPADVVRLAAAAGLNVIALTDHDTVAGVIEARAAGADLGVRVVAGCEFSVAAPWGELHLLAYFLPTGRPELVTFLDAQRGQRTTRMREIVRRLRGAGVTLTLEQVGEEAGSGALGRPHAARTLVARGVVADVGEAFDRYLRRGRPAYVPKVLPALSEVTGLVRSLGGVTSAAHLKERATRAALRRLQRDGVDAVEVRHPSHEPALQERIGSLAGALGLLRTGGTDWHGEAEVAEGRAALGAITVPEAWVDELEQLHRTRRAKGGSDEW
jgi:predicted metal-dependent phosphoesterase TrpH